MVRSEVGTERHGRRLRAFTSLPYPMKKLGSDKAGRIADSQKSRILVASDVVVRTAGATLKSVSPFRKHPARRWVDVPGVVGYPYWRNVRERN